MKKIIVLLVCIVFCTSCSGPRKVVDFSVISSLVSIHKKQHGKYKTIKEKEGVNLGLQALVTEHTNQNKEITDKIKKRYTDATLLLQDVARIPFAIDILNDIYQYQEDILAIVQDHPELAALAIQTEVAMLKRVNRLYKYVYLYAIIPGDYNRIPQAKRTEIIDHVIDELRIIRGFCYSIKRKMRNGLYGSLIKQVIQEWDVNGLYEGVDRLNIVNEAMSN